MEDFDLETRLLTLKNFADGTFISVPSRYVLPVTTVSAYPSLEAMLGEVVAWHVQNELSIRDVKSHDEAFVSTICIYLYLGDLTKFSNSTIRF
jgi:hypothetical protein